MTEYTNAKQGPTSHIQKNTVGYWRWTVRLPNVPGLSSYKPGLPDMVIGFSESQEEAILHSQECTKTTFQFPLGAAWQ